MKNCTADNRARALERPSANLSALLRERFQFLRDFVRPHHRVLEVGTGIGITERYLPAVDYWATDIEPNPWIDVVANGESLPFAAESFDAVICIAALHHMDHPLAALREMARVLKPSGAALIMEVHTSWLTRLVLSITRHEYVDLSVSPFGPGSCQSRGATTGAEIMRSAICCF
jgi:SAM-dependent methyltransferase